MKISKTLLVLIGFTIGLIGLLTLSSRYYMSRINFDLYNNGKIICFKRETAGFIKTSKNSCFKLEAIK